jgi:hypothetical protein
VKTKKIAVSQDHNSENGNTVYAQNKQYRYRNSITNITWNTIYQHTHYIKLEENKNVKMYFTGLVGCNSM